MSLVGLSTTDTRIRGELGPVVRKLDSDIHRRVIFSSAVKMLKNYEIADMDQAADKGKV